MDKENGRCYGVAEVNGNGQHLYSSNKAGWRMVDRMD